MAMEPEDMVDRYQQLMASTYMFCTCPVVIS